MRWWDLQRNSNHTTIVTIEKVIDETPTVRTLVFSDSCHAKCFAWSICNGLDSWN